MAEPFCKTRSLAEMTDGEWESLCDGCGRCCLVKLEDEDDGAIHFTDIAVRLRARPHTHGTTAAEKASE